MDTRQQEVLTSTPEISAPMTVRNVRGKARKLPWVSIIILGAFLFVSVFAGILSPYNPREMHLVDRFRPPGLETGRLYLLGTDTLGRDVLTRVLYGGRISLIVGGFALLFGGGLGLLMGIVSGYFGGKVDGVLMRLTDCFMALPDLLIALVFVMTIGPGLWTVIIALSVLMWAQFARIIRSEVLTLKRREFVLLAKVAGCSGVKIMLVHIVPNVLNTFMVICAMVMSQAVLTEASLSFLGAGVPPPTPSWGNMLSDGRAYVDTAWWIACFPGLALALVVFSFNSFGDWLRDATDPKLRQL